MALSTYLTFNGNCEEALKFYAAALGTEINEIHYYADMPGDQVPEEFKSKVMHGNLTYKGSVLMGSDSIPGMGGDENCVPFDGKYCGFSVSASTDNAADADRIFEALSKGGKVTMPIAETFWAERFGMFVDQFNIAWMVNCEKKQA